MGKNKPTKEFRRRRFCASVPGLFLLLIFSGCGQFPVPNSEGAARPNPSGNPSEGTVGDVFTGTFGSGSGQHPPGTGVSARVRNESNAQVDVTLRFLRGNTIVHLAFVRVLPKTVTTVSSPMLADILEASGTSESGVALRSLALVFGRDFDEQTPAEYVIDENLGGFFPPGEIPPDEEPPDAEPLFLSILEPTQPVELHNGDRLRVRWEESTVDTGATVVFALEKTDGVGRFVISSSLTATGGVRTASFLIQGLNPGLYDLVGTIDDGADAKTTRITGVVRVLEDSVNPPQLILLEPNEDIEVELGDELFVEWLDSDASGLARVSLLLDPDLDLGFLTGNEILLASDLPAGGPDRQINLTIPSTIPPAVYRLAGVISDGATQSVTWAPGLVFAGVPMSDNDPPELELMEPADEVFTRLGESVGYLLEAANVPDGTEPRLFLSNVAHGGNVRADVTPADLMTNEPGVLTLPAAGNRIPNDAWPRQFDLEAEVVVGSTVHRSVAPAAVWIRQEVQIESVRMVNYDCLGPIEPLLDGTSFRGVEIRWFGGGFKEREPHDPVEFWLSFDGTLAVDQEPDERHFLFVEVPESPNLLKTSRVSLGRLVEVPARITDELAPLFEEGEYQAIAVVNSALFGRLTTGPHDDRVELCFPFVIPP